MVFFGPNSGIKYLVFPEFRYLVYDTEIYNLYLPKSEDLKKTMVKKAHCTCIEALDGKFAMPVGVHYLPRATTGEERLKQSVESIECIQTCLSCIRRGKMSFEGSVLKVNSHCKLRCLECITQHAVSQGCKEIGHKFVRACDECLEEGVECVKMVSLAWIVNQRIKNSHRTLSQNQRHNGQPNKAATKEMLTAFLTLFMLTK